MAQPPSSDSRRSCLTHLGLLVTGLWLRPALASPQVQRATRPLLGTRVDIVAQGPTQARTVLAIEAAFAEMARLEGLMSRYRPDSQVAALQRAAGQHALPVAPELFAVLQQAAQVSAASAGAFDITVGAYADWDFAGPQPQVPRPDTLARESRLVNHRDVVLNEHLGTAYLRRPGMKLDLGGIAKLPILQAGMRVLQQHGVPNAMLNGGGDVLVNGQLQGQDWRIGLRDPRQPERLLGVVALSEGWVASSGDYERCFDQGGRRYHHVLNPHTGWPSTGVHGVALVGRRLQDLNGLGTTIMVAGATTGQRLLAERPPIDALIVAGDAQPWMTPGLARRLRTSGTISANLG